MSQGWALILYSFEPISLWVYSFISRLSVIQWTNRVCRCFPPPFLVQIHGTRKWHCRAESTNAHLFSRAPSIDLQKHRYIEESMEPLREWLPVQLGRPYSANWLGSHCSEVIHVVAGQVQLAQGERQVSSSLIGFVVNYRTTLPLQEFSCVSS